jgi:hypothetical protein
MLRAAPRVLEFEFEVEVGRAGLPGVTAVEDVLAGDDTIAEVDVEFGAVAVDVAQSGRGLD